MLCVMYKLYVYVYNIILIKTSYTQISKNRIFINGITNWNIKPYKISRKN